MHFFLVLVIGVAAWGCGNDNSNGSAGSGGGGGAGGMGDDSLDLDIGPGDVRAGRLSADQLPEDPNGLALYDPTIPNRNDQLQTLDPVHPGRLPFGVTNPIFFAP